MADVRPVPPAAPEPPDALALGRWLGAHRWLELQLFEVLGAWSASADEPGARSLLAALSRHHAWHAELLAGCVPEVAGTTVDSVTGPGGAEPVVAALRNAGERSTEGEAGGADRVDAVGAVAAVVRSVLPRLIVTYADRQAALSPVRDAPVIRALGLILHDLRADWEAGEAHLQRMLAADPAAAARAGSTVAVDAAFAAAGLTVAS